MGRLLAGIYLWFWTRIRLLRLRFVVMEVPEDAKTPEQMLEEIKKRLESA